MTIKTMAPLSLCLLILLFHRGTAFVFQSKSYTKTVGILGNPLEAFVEADQGLNRREMIGSSAAAFLALLINPIKTGAVDPKVVLITGSNSGIGFEASKRLAEQGHTVIMGCRTLSKAENAINDIRNSVSTGTLIPAECDLSSLDSIKSFVKNLKIEQLDVVCLNAGLALDAQAKDIQRTMDGFELTVGVNHLGHFYLNHLLLPKIKSNGGKIVVTASSVHDPESPGGKQGIPASLGDLTGFERDGKMFEMVDGNAYNGDKAYKDSKLCNVLFTRELQRQLENNDATKGITVNCFSPGLITSSGFFRNQNPLFSKAFGFIVENIAKVAETPSWGGGCLAYMATEVNTRGEFWDSAPGSSKFGDAAYGQQFSIGQVSKEAQDNAEAKKLWKLSEKLVGISV